MLLLFVLVTLAGFVSPTKLTCPECRSDVREFTQRFCEVYEVHKSSKDGGGDIDGHCMQFMDSIEDSPEDHSSIYYDMMCASLDFCPKPENFPEDLPSAEDECIDCSKKLKNYLGIFCQLYEKFIDKMNIDYQNMGECLNLVNAIQDYVFMDTCGLIGKCGQSSSRP